MKRAHVWVLILSATLPASWLGCSGTIATAGSSSTKGAGGTSSHASSSHASSTSGVTVGPGAGVGGGAGAGGAGGGISGAGIQCNPVTNAPCMATEQCDTNFDTNGNIVGFVCWPSNGVGLCMTCDPGNNLACAPSETCFTYDQNGDSACAQYCCTDADCGTGTCQTSNMGMPWFAPVAPNLGICIAATPDAGLPDGSAPDPYQCTVPSTPPSGGSCVTIGM